MRLSAEGSYFKSSTKCLWLVFGLCYFDEGYFIVFWCDIYSIQYYSILLNLIFLSVSFKQTLAAHAEHFLLSYKQYIILLSNVYFYTKSVLVCLCVILMSLYFER